MKTELYNHTNSKQSEETLSRQSLHCEQSEHQLRSSIEANIAQGNYAVAIAIINQLITLRPNSAIDYNNRGLMYFRNNQLAEAIQDLTHALEIDPTLDSAYNNRANCHAAQGDFVAAISDYDNALDLNPANIRAWINQGITYRDMGSYELAIGNFDIALIISHTLQERVYAEKGRTYHLRGDWNCAVSDYKKALELLVNKPELATYKHKVEAWLTELLHPVFPN
ncbi:MAG: tetratricopeptide repeat protein [Xenococcaceae cyanobacterium MO_167.B27]|nr:tetratricopeptide repeat protein [Xenococcaceae cyanobacterium MO_167.B27]